MNRVNGVPNELIGEKWRRYERGRDFRGIGAEAPFAVKEDEGAEAKEDA